MPKKPKDVRTRANDLLSKTVGVRIDELLYDRLQKAYELTGVEPANMGRAALEAVVSYIEENGNIVLPLAVMPISDYERLSRIQESMKE